MAFEKRDYAPRDEEVLKMEKIMNWIKIEQKEIDLKLIHFISDGKTVWIRGNELNNFLFHVKGPQKTIAEMDFKFWMPLPEPPSFE